MGINWISIGSPCNELGIAYISGIKGLGIKIEKLVTIVNSEIKWPLTNFLTFHIICILIVPI